MDNTDITYTKYKYITTTLPYLNSTPHIGHCFEFVLADVIAEFYRLSVGELEQTNVIFNVGVDEHGQKVYQKAIDEGYTNTIDYCNVLNDKWVAFCDKFQINYDNFYRTSSEAHKRDVLRFYDEIKQYVYEKEYTGHYCVGCESFITEKEIVDGKCPIHNTDLILTKEVNKFFNLTKFKLDIKDILVDKSKSNELKNIIADDFDLSITRQNVKWGIETEDGSVFYVWFEALLNYIFAIKYYEDKEHFNKYWKNSLIICGKDNLKFQAYILQALLKSNNIPQTKEVLVHGNILDEHGAKMSKTTGNVIDPVEQYNKYGLDPVRYYLAFGLNTFSDSKYSEKDLIHKWNSEVVGGLGNLISRLLHLVDIRNVEVDSEKLSADALRKIMTNVNNITINFEKYNIKGVGEILTDIVNDLNRRISLERPFDASCENYAEIINELYYGLETVITFYSLVLKNHAHVLHGALENKKKIILFDKIEEIK